MFPALVVGSLALTGAPLAFSSEDAETVLIRADKVIVRPGVVETDVGVLVSRGKIVAVEKGLATPEGAREIRGKVVCAGFIDPWSGFSLDPQAVGDERASAATRTTDAIDAYTDPRFRDEVLRAGVTSLRLQAGSSAKVSGLGAFVRNHPTTTGERAVILDDACLSLSLGITRGDRGLDVFDRANDVDRALGALGDGLTYLQDRVEYKHELEEWQKTIGEKEKELEEGFKKAKKDREKEEAEAKEKGKEFKQKSYKEDKKPKPPRYDADKEVLARAIDGRMPCVVEVQRGAEMRGLLEGAKRFDRLRLIVAGGTESVPFAKELAERRIPVIVVPALLGKQRPWELREADPALAGQLTAAGVQVLIGSGGNPDLSSRDLPMLAAVAIGHGLERDAALAAVTTKAAEALDVADRVGSVEVGKDADLLVLDGEPLSTTTRVLYVLSGGDVVVTPED